MIPLTQYNIFIASPGDVTEEREIIRKTCDKLNTNPLVEGKRVHLKAVGWEDEMPSAGDPQEIINRLAEKCDLFICLFYRRFGSPSASADSGTLEEFLNAYDRWKREKKPEIMLYFKEVKISSRKDLLDKQLNKVMGFKEKVQQERLVFYKEFGDAGDFKDQLDDHLLKWILRYTPATAREEEESKAGESAGPAFSGKKGNFSRKDKASHQPEPPLSADRNKAFHQHKTTPSFEPDKAFHQQKTTTPTSAGLFRLLHISDLHINGDKEAFDRSVVVDPFLERLAFDLEAGLAPELVLVSGDIAFKGAREEYEYARAFFDRLLGVLGLPQERLFMVPGNHDVDRSKYRKSDVPRYEEMKDLNEELENDDHRGDLLKGMKEWFDFIRQAYPHMRFSGKKDLVPFVNTYQAECGLKLGLVGLNSAWMSRKSPDREEVAIGEYQIKSAYEELNRTGGADLVINLFHHPIEWLWPRDSKICKNYFDGSLCLTGHLHETGGGFTAGYERRYYQFQAGGLYLGADSMFPAAYQYLTINRAGKSARLDFRCFDGETRRWIVDARRGEDGKSVFPGVLKKKSLNKKQEKDRTFLRRFDHYLSSVHNEHCHLPVMGFETTFRHPVLIRRVYVKMKAHVQYQDREHTLEGMKRAERKWESEGASLLDMKGSMETLKRHHIKDMVILGDPGSGKTTLLKFICVTLIEGKGEEVGLDTNLVPFFAPLRELKEPEKIGFLEFMAYSTQFEERGISKKSFIKLLKEGKGLILLDGLDEVGEQGLRLKVIQWIDKARLILGKTPFIITSRYAGYTGKYQLEGSILPLSVQPFTMEEIRLFLGNWFCAVEECLHKEREDAGKQGKKKAASLIKEIEKSKSLRDFVTNPLILQITALVHRDRGKLPERRVELYEECTNILLSTWDEAKELEGGLSSRDSRSLLQPLALWLHSQDERRSAPLKEIVEVLREPLAALGKPDLKPESLLLSIRDRSGIFMGYSHEEYGFVHLSFQEYLAACEIRNKGMIDLLVNNYANREWREVILLSLALENPSLLEPFLEAVVKTKAFEKEVTLVTDALRDSRVEPVKLFVNAMKDQAISEKAKGNIVVLLKNMKSDAAERALKEIARGGSKPSVREVFIFPEDKKNVVNLTAPELAKEIIHEKDGAPMVLVPGGSFLYGSREDDKEARQNEKPQRTILLDAFYMDKYPVTNRQYCRFLNETLPGKKDLNKWIELSGSYEKEKCHIIRQERNYVVEKGYNNYPVIYVTWYGADVYAQWAGKRLPSEQEWEKAARGTDGRRYPWGEEWHREFCNSRESGEGKITPVDQYNDGRSPYGCQDMAGNVFEWTSSKEGGDYILRGGSFYSDRDFCRCACRGFSLPALRFDLMGFRCART